ncbi:hypothetical protein LDB00_10265, partial [Enterococcus faecium]|nr:hypothetical protein [Enterococcus faecium]
SFLLLSFSIILPYLIVDLKLCNRTFHLLDQLTIAVKEGWTFEQLEEHELFFQPEYRVPDMVWSKVANTAYED